MEREGPAQPSLGLEAILFLGVLPPLAEVMGPRHQPLVDQVDQVGVVALDLLAQDLLVLLFPIREILAGLDLVP